MPARTAGGGSHRRRGHDADDPRARLARRRFRRGAEWRARGDLEQETAHRGDETQASEAVAREPAPATDKTSQKSAAGPGAPGVVWAGPLGQRASNNSAAALAKRRLAAASCGDEVLEAVVADEALVQHHLRGKVEAPWEKDRAKGLPAGIRCARLRVAGGRDAAKRVARALRDAPRGEAGWRRRGGVRRGSGRRARTALP